MKGTPPAWAAAPSTHESPTTTMPAASGQRSRTTRRPSGSGLSRRISSRVTIRSRCGSRSKRARTKSATTRSLLVQMAVAKPRSFMAATASRANGTRVASLMARRSCATGIASSSASRCTASRRTRSNSSAPDQRSARAGTLMPRARTKASMSRPTAFRSSGELTRVWSRSKTQTAGPVPMPRPPAPSGSAPAGGPSGSGCRRGARPRPRGPRTRRARAAGARRRPAGSPRAG